MPLPEKRFPVMSWCDAVRATNNANNIDNVDWMYFLSDDGVNNDNGLFIFAGNAYGGRLLLLAGWQINLIVCSRWANLTTRDHN